MLKECAEIVERLLEILLKISLEEGVVTKGSGREQMLCLSFKIGGREIALKYRSASLINVICITLEKIESKWIITCSDSLVISYCHFFPIYITPRYPAKKSGYIRNKKIDKYKEIYSMNTLLCITSKYLPYR